jgi:outer membrane protein OmpA-like peptidoglycan-associated protein
MTDMKTILKFSICTTMLFVLTVATAVGQNNKISYIPEGRYLVIGTFHIKSNAVGFTNYVKTMDKYDVKLSYHPITKYYYVVIKGYDKGNDGLADVKRMRQETEFIDTWYMVVEPYTFNDNSESIASPVAVKEEANDEKEDKTGEADGWVKVSSSSVAEKKETEANNIVEDDTNLGRATDLSLGNEQPTGKNFVPVTYAEKGVYKLYFNAYYIRNFKEIKGSVEIINPKTLRLLRVAQSLELVMIPDPNNGEHSIQLIANIFGYKKVQHDFRLTEPFDSVNQEFLHFKGDTLIADFPLRRYDQGEIATMYNVFFFKDASIMKPISKFELNSLVDMLKENDDLKIKIHGHTNGSARGKIITAPEGSEKFFTLNQEVVEDYGSAKDLSLRRAEIIKNYLVSYGINASRMQVIGWGGKKPIYDKMDKLAVKNVRVEIEILEN